MHLVSIVIPAFNQGRFLQQAIESALSQTHTALEVIVVDDGSTDETVEVCARLAADSRVRVIQQRNQGVGAARNRGARAASGDYLCFLDADDFYHHEKVELQARLLDECPAIDWVYCDIVGVDENGRPADDSYSVAASRTCLNGDIFDSLVLGGFFPPHTVMLRRKIFEAIGGFDPALGGNADLDLWLRMAARGHRVEFVDRRLAYYRTHEAGMSRDRSHMQDTRRTALAGIARAFPERTAAAISRLQDVNEELHLGNQWLNDALSRLWAEPPLLSDIWSLSERVASGDSDSLTYGQGRAEIWDATLGNEFDRAVLLHPPARLTCRVPTGEACRIAGFVGIHVDVHNHPKSGPVRFQLTVDDRLRWTCVVDAKHREEDRSWLPFALDVPARASGDHEVRLETEGIGGEAFRWALWRGVAVSQPTFSSQKLQPKAGCTPR
jgi:glycosyltransferase involved in cell wall biosynthesis